MSNRISLVITTIGDGAFLESFKNSIFRENMKENIEIIIIPDRKTPVSIFEKCKELATVGITTYCPTLEEQDAFLSKLGAIKHIIPYNSDNRRNIGFLMAYEQECDVLLSMDDDNFVSENAPFFKEHLIVGESLAMEAVNSEDGWFNICELLEVDPPTTYPRGFPYHSRHKTPKLSFEKEEGIIHVNAGLWYGHPDIDAISCMYSPASVKAFKGKSVLLGANTWSPINTQNTAIAREAIAAYYFLRMNYPLMGIPIDRDGDIFSGYFVQACAKHLGYQIRFGSPLTDHKRNVHNYLKDLTHELACIWILEDITSWLQELKLDGDNYIDTYMFLANQIDDAVEQLFDGFIWNDATRGYFHYVTYCMRTWIGAIKTIEGK